jgi:Flp pilus assembly protein TadD
LGAKDFKKAEDAYRKALELNPKFNEPHLGLGLVFLARGDLKGVKRELEFLERAKSPLAAKLRQKAGL